MGETLAQGKKRMVEQDIAKGIAILIVVFVHSVQLKTTAMNWLVATTGYAMPFFYFMSGYNYKPGRGTWGQNVVKRIKQILWPLLYYSVGIYIVMTIYFMIRQEATVGDALRAFASFWLTRPLTTWVGLNVDFSNPLAGLLGQGWFLQYMMTAYLIFYFVADYALKTTGRFLSVNIALLAVTCVFTALEITLPWGIHAAPLIASMMLFGALFGQRKLLHKGTIPPEWNIPNTVAAFAIYLAFGLLYPKAGQFAAGILGHDIGFWDVFMTLLSAILGSYILVNISKVLERVPVVNTAMEWCGSNSLQILLIHMCFIRIFSNAFHIVRPPMGTEIEQTNGMTVLVCVLAVAATAAFVILFRAVKKSLRRKRERHEST